MVAAQHVAITPDVGRLQPASGPVVNYDVMTDPSEPPSELRITSKLSWSASWKNLNGLMIGACDGLMGNATALAQIKVRFSTPLHGCLFVRSLIPQSVRDPDWAALAPRPHDPHAISSPLSDCQTHSALHASCQHICIAASFDARRPLEQMS